jgi:plasmid stabilization system protein ParE
MGILLSDKVGADLLRIFSYIDEHSPNAAIEFIRRIETNFENLLRFPFIGRSVPISPPDCGVSSSACI